MARTFARRSDCRRSRTKYWRPTSPPFPAEADMGSEQRGTRHALYLAAVSGAARGPGFVIPLLIATVFGAGARTDAYFLVYSAVLLVGGTLGQGIEVAIVPFS